MIKTDTEQFERCQALDGSVGYFWPDASILVEEKAKDGALLIHPLMGDKTDSAGVHDLSKSEMYDYLAPVAALLGGGVI